jgi:ribosome-binding protein aMBF1 (putative translation factor)
MKYLHPYKICQPHKKVGILKNIDDLDENAVQDFYKKIGSNVKTLRQKNGLSQLELSQALGFKSVTMVSCCEICHNNYHFNIEHLHKIAYILEVDICEFFKPSHQHISQI